MSSFPLSLIQALQRRNRTSAPSVDVTLPDTAQPRIVPPAHFDDEVATDMLDRSPRTTQPTGSGMYRPMETPPERAGRIVQDLPQGNGDDNTPDAWLRQATRPRVAALPEGTVTDLPDTGAYTRATPAPDTMTAPNLDFRPDMQRSTIDIGEGLRSPDAQRVRDAMELRRNVEADKPRGFWGKVGRTLKGIGEGAIQGAARGGGLGMLAGAVAGGVSPKYADKMSDEVEFQRRLPENVQSENLRFKQRQADRQDTAEQRQLAILERQNQVAKTNADNIAEDNRLNRERIQFDRDKQTQLEKDKSADNQRALDQNLFTRRRDLTKENAERIDLADLFTPRLDPRTGKNTGNMGQVVPVQQGEAYRLPSQAQEDSRKLQQVANESRAREAADFEKQIKLLPLKEKQFANEEAIRQSYKDSNDKLDLEGVPTVNDFEKTKSDALSLYQRAENARNTAAKAPKGSPTQIDNEAASAKLQAQADAAFGDMWAKYHHMMRSGGYDDNSAGGWAGLNRKVRTKKGGVVGGSSPQGASRTKTPPTLTKATYDEMVKDAAKGDKDAIDGLKDIQAGKWIVK